MRRTRCRLCRKPWLAQTAEKPGAPRWPTTRPGSGRIDGLFEGEGGGGFLAALVGEGGFVAVAGLDLVEELLVAAWAELHSLEDHRRLAETGTRLE